MIKKCVIYKGVRYPLDILSESDKELMKVEIEKQHPDYFKKKVVEVKKEVHNKKELD